MNYKYQYDRKFKFDLHGDKWEAYLVTEEELKELDVSIEDAGEETPEGDHPAMILPREKCIFVVEGSVNKNVITHELFHMIVEYFYLQSANVTVDQFEEVVATYLENDLDKFVKIRNKLLKEYKKIEGMYK